MKRIIPIAGLLVAISGCMSTEELRKQDAAKCSGYGFRAGTPQFVQCMMQQDRQANKEEQCRQIYLSAFGTAAPEKGFGYQSAVAAKAQAECMQRP